MAERGIVETNFLPMGGAGSGYKCDFVPVGVNYSLIAASATGSPLGAGAIGDYIGNVTIIPATSAPGAVSIKDGGGSAQTIFAGGTLADIKPFVIPVLARSTSGGWTVTTGNNVSALIGGSSY